MNEEKKPEKGELEKLRDEMDESVKKADERIEELKREGAVASLSSPENFIKLIRNMGLILMVLGIIKLLFPSLLFKEWLGLGMKLISTTFIVSGIIMFFIGSGCKIIPAVFQGIVTRFGKLEEKARKEGLTFLIPFVEEMTLWPINQRTLPIPLEDTYTKDRMLVTAKIAIWWKIIDPIKMKRSLGTIKSVEDKIVFKTHAAQRMFFASHTLNEALGEGSFAELATIIKNHLKDEIVDDKYLGKEIGIEDAEGILIIEVKIFDVEPAQETRELIAKKQRTEYEKEAALVEADKNKAVVVKKAEAEKQETILKAEANKARVIAEAEAKQQEINLIAKELGISDKSDQYFALIAYFEALKVVGSSNSSKIIIPQELSSIIGVVTTMIESLKKDKEEKK